nr:hypothetical protein [Tanacetum cinerariifolium]
MVENDVPQLVDQKGKVFSSSTPRLGVGYSDDEVDARSSVEYLTDLNIKVQEKALLANSKGFIKRKKSRAEYKKMKSKLALLKVGLSTSQSSKTCQSKNMGPVTETNDWDEEEVTSDDEEMVEDNVPIALTDDENLAVGKNHARNSEWSTSL